MQTNPCVFRAGNGDLHLRVLLHILVDVLGVVGAEPQLAVQFASEHKRAALCLTVTTDGSQILHGVGIQKFNDFIHDKYLRNLLFSLDALIVMRFVRLVKYAQYCGMVTSG